MTSSEKADAFAQFNDTDSNIKVLLLNTMVGAAGLNLHGSCAFGIQVQMPWSYHTSAQMLRRLVRLKQTKEVTWVMIRVNGSVYDFVEHKASGKEAQALAAQLNFSDWQDNKLCRKVISYEVLRAFWSQPFNRMAWEVMGIQEIQDFNSNVMRAAGHFFHLFAQLLLTTAEEDLPEDGYGNLLEQVEDVLVALPSFWIRQHCVNESKPEPSELPDELTWEALRKLIEDCDANPDAVSSITGSAPATEFGSNQSRRQYFKKTVDESSSPKSPKKRKAGEYGAPASSSPAAPKRQKKKLSSEYVHDSESDGEENVENPEEQMDLDGTVSDAESMKSNYSYIGPKHATKEDIMAAIAF